MGFRFHQEKGPYHCSWDPDSGMTSVHCFGWGPFPGAQHPSSSQKQGPKPEWTPTPTPSLGTLCPVFKRYGLEAEKPGSLSVTGRPPKQDGVMGSCHCPGSAPILTWAVIRASLLYLLRPRLLFQPEWSSTGTSSQHPYPCTRPPRTCSTLGCRSRSSSTISLSSLWAASR